MKALVTGGGGFLGSALSRLLRRRGGEVRSLSRSLHPALEPLGVEQVRGDLEDLEAVRRASEGCDIVFHVAAKAGVWGARAEFYRTNVTGTENVVTACRAAGVPRLVHTSSPSVVFDGRDIEGANESLPYPERFEAHYPRTKMLAERLVLAANDASLATVALRPHLIWGPGDQHLVPRILERGRAGILRRIGGAGKLVDSTWIDDAARAHVLAADRLAPGSPVAGKAYFISQGEPVPLWDLVDGILAAGGLAPVARSISPRVAYAAGAVLEAFHTLGLRRGEPRMTRFLARELSCAHWFDISAARRDLGYEPELSIAAGLERLAASLAADRVSVSRSHSQPGAHLDREW